jgi:peptide/nickel transport system ATP-binding protein
LSRWILEVKNLRTEFLTEDGAIPAVDGITWRMGKGETLALVGESGCGKSVTSLSIMGLLPEHGRIATGEILLEGKDLCKNSEGQWMKVRGNEIAMIFQEPMTSLNPVLSIGEQMTEGLRKHRKMSRQEANQEAIKALQLVGFPRAKEMMKEYPHQLSGGMRQRVMIAMAMVNNPKVLIADEPTTALDVTIQAQILELMRKVKEDFDTSILLITHDLGVVAEMADRVIVMYAGQIVEEADVKDLFLNPSHPYTDGLLKAVPSLEEEQTRLYSISGTVPLMNDLPTGCRFAPRCQRAMEKCLQAEPKLYQVYENHYARCFLYENPIEGTSNDD